MIEVLVAATLLAIMFAVATMNVTEYINNARDATRKSHLERYRVAMEEYFSDYGYYPDPSKLAACGSNELDPYMSEVYCDPLTNDPYRYVRTQNRVHYELWAVLSNEYDPVIEMRGCDTGCGPDDNGDGRGDYNYGISDEQIEIGTGSGGGVQEPLCTSGGTKYCIAGQCSNCCPGDIYRCNSTGTGCYIDYSCRDF